MGNRSWVGVGNGGDSTLHNSSGWPGPQIYSPMGGPSPVEPVQTTPAQAICRGAMSLKGMIMQFNQITGVSGDVASVTAGVSIAGSSTPGNQSCVLNNQGFTSTAFTLTDTTHSDVVADGQTYGLVYTGISGTATGIVNASVSFEQFAVSANYVLLTDFAAPASSLVNSSSKFLPMIGSMHAAGSGLETSNQLQTPYAATLDHMQFALSANAGSVTVTSRVNSAAGNQTTNAAGSATGTFEDTTHTDACPAGALVAYKASSTTTCTFTFFSTRLGSANPAQSGLYAAVGGGNASSTTQTVYCAFSGILRTDTVHGEVLIDAPMNGTLSLLNVLLNSPNASTTSSTFTLMRGASGSVTGNQTLTFGAGVAGTLIDATHTDALIAAVDMVELQLPATEAAINPQGMAAMFTAPPAVTQDASLLMGVG